MSSSSESIENKAQMIFDLKTTETRCPTSPKQRSFEQKKDAFFKKKLMDCHVELDENEMPCEHQRSNAMNITTVDQHVQDGAQSFSSVNAMSPFLHCSSPCALEVNSPLLF